MDKLIINGGNKLEGEVNIHGAKNSALPILCASILCKDKVILHNCPKLSDVNNTIEILKYFDCKVTREDDTLEIIPSSENITDIPESLMSKMRSSIIFLGALLSKNKSARLCFPGGCELGPRPIDIHLSCLEKLGVDISEKFGVLDCKVNKCINGVSLNLPFPSVGATENVMLAAVLGNGTTTIHNAAREPEIVDLANFLNKCGAKISGAGENVISIVGVESLHGCEHTIIPDRIETSTYMSFAGITGSEIQINNICADHIQPVIDAYIEAGCKLNIRDNSIFIKAPKKPKRVNQIKTMVYPGFPTDSGAPFISMCSVADGTSVFIETIFQNRYKAIEEMIKMGANIKTYDRIAVIEGVNKLYGAEVKATDLRGGAALIAAALGAEGVTTITEVSHIDRGYENIEDSLYNLGADIRREKDGI